MPPEPVTPPPAPVDNHAAQAIRFLLIKAAIFIGIPIVASVIAVFLTLR